MAQRMLTWEDLSEPVRRIVRWAAAAQSEPARQLQGLLVGLLREPRDSPLRTLLGHFEISDDELFGALRAQSRASAEHVRRRPAGLRELPPLSRTPSASSLRAAEIHDEFHTEDVNADCVLGALLETGASTAAIALSRRSRRSRCRSCSAATSTGWAPTACRGRRRSTATSRSAGGPRRRRCRTRCRRGRRRRRAGAADLAAHLRAAGRPGCARRDAVCARSGVLRRSRPRRDGAHAARRADDPQR